jgi:hypothetical protein
MLAEERGMVLGNASSNDLLDMRWRGRWLVGTQVGLSHLGSADLLLDLHLVAKLPLHL